MLPEKFAIYSSEIGDPRWKDYMCWVSINIQNSYELGGNALNSYFNFGKNYYYTSDGSYYSNLPYKYTILTLKQFFKMKEEKEFIPEVGKEYLFNVVNNLQTGYKLIFLGKTLNGKFISSIKEDDGCCSIWNYCFPIPETLEVTLEQIAEKFNVSVDKIKIKK